MKRRIGCVLVGFLSLVLSLVAQTSGVSPASAQVPPLIQFSNVATDEGGNSLSGVVNITFSLYNSQRGGEPLWTETQNNVQLDSTGHYSVQLGITKPNGVPAALFTSGEARWLGVQIADEAEQPRVLLLSVPYALKAGDAATIGGLPPSAFVLAAPQNGAASAYTTTSATRQSISPATATDVTTTGGKASYLPLFNGASSIIDSVVYQTTGGVIHLPDLSLLNTTSGGTQGVIEFGGVPFIHNYGPPGSYNSFFGRLAGNLTNTGIFLTAVGDYALDSNTSGQNNTALGYNAGAANTAGSNNTFIGYGANPGSNTLSNATAIGANAVVSESNALVLGGTGANVVSVGIGTTTPNSKYALDVQGSGYFSNQVFIGTPTSNEGLDQLGIQQPSLSIGDAVGAYGFSATTGSGGNGGLASYAQGGYGDLESSTSGGGTAGHFQGGTGGGPGGDGIYALYGPGGTFAQNGYAGYFSGNVEITGTLNGSSPTAKIDHPLDPANKYFLHASVESSEMMNIYTGNVVLDSKGAAVIRLPEWFSSLNRDFRYQLTSIGAPGPNLYVAEEIAENSFKIAGGHPGAKVSWQITGVRQDAYAKANPLVVEQAKDARERGHYIHPELYGASEQQSIDWARHPEMMMRMQKIRAKQQATIRAAAQPATAQSK